VVFDKGSDEIRCERTRLWLEIVAGCVKFGRDSKIEQQFGEWEEMGFANLRHECPIWLAIVWEETFFIVIM